MAESGQFESNLRIIVGAVLWSESAAATISLFSSLAAGDSVRIFVLVVLAIGLEGAKILSWRKGGWFRLLSLFLIALSILGSLGSAMMIVRDYRHETLRVAVRDSPQSTNVKKQIADLDRQFDVVTRRLESLPPDYVTAARGLIREIDVLRAERTGLVNSTRTEEQVPASLTMFDLIAHVFGIPVDALIFGLLMFLATLLEVSALALASDHNSVGHSSVPVGQPKSENPTSADFLRAAKDGAPLPVLHGRDVTAKKLGVSYYHAKQMVAELKASGIIRSEGKRLVLCDK